MKKNQFNNKSGHTRIAAACSYTRRYEGGKLIYRIKHNSQCCNVKQCNTLKCDSEQLS